jgi:hypothetical protein
MDHRFLQTIYQQWADGQTNAQARWLDFVEMAAKINGTTADVVMKELQKCHWFKWGDR